MKRLLHPHVHPNPVSRRVSAKILIVATLFVTMNGAAISHGQDFEDGSATSVSVVRTNYEFQKIGGVEYRSGDDFRLTLDVYVPDGAGPYPAILAVHGGSWRSGTKLNLFRHARKLARAGYVVVAINYRHAPEFRFPAQIHDCKAAVRWMRLNASEYKIDTTQIGGFGYSAGGHLVALLGTTDEDDDLEGEMTDEEKSVSTRLQAVVGGGAPCEFSWIDKNSSTLVPWLGSRMSDDPAIYEQASPTHYISADDPPFFLFHGTDDWVVPPDSSRQMHRLLLEQSVESHYETYEGYGHFALFSHLDAMDPVIEFFNKTLQRNQAP